METAVGLDWIRIRLHTLPRKGAKPMPARTERQAERQCECSDPKCPQCKGSCLSDAKKVLYRIDMQGEDGTPMCQGCALDAMESGLFGEEDY